VSVAQRQVEGPGSAVVHARLREQVAELRLRDPDVRDNLPDAVHKMRVAIRRLRSALATFRPLFDEQVSEPLREELKWIAGLLGEARDADVLRERLGASIAEEPVELVLGPVSARVEGELGNACRDALARSAKAMKSERYLGLLDSLDTLVSDPPWTKAGHPARTDLLGRFRHDWKRLRRLVAAADDASDPAKRDHLLHEVRKAAKRVRYSAETLVPAYGRDAERLAKAAERVQSVLGEHQDSAVAQDCLRRLGMQADLDGQNAFTYGRLHAQERVRADDSAAKFTKTWDKASRKKLRRWLG